MQYKITCPFCRGEIRIQHAGEGIWAISVDEMAYESCAAFVFNLGTFCDSTSDDDILQLLDTIGCKTINGEAVV